MNCQKVREAAGEELYCKWSPKRGPNHKNAKEKTTAVKILCTKSIQQYTQVCKSIVTHLSNIQMQNNYNWTITIKFWETITKKLSIITMLTVNAIS